MPDGYQQDARPFVSSAQPETVTVMLDMDTDLLDWLQENPLWKREILDLLRAYMEINLIRKTAFEDAAADQRREVFKMPDGNQGRPFNYRPPQPETSPQAFNFPGATNPAAGVARAIAFAKGMSRKAFILMGVVAFFQYVMPDNLKPSNIIGGFHGATESAELKAKQPAAAEYEGTLADAKARAATSWQMEAEAFRQQQEVTARSLETMATAAQIADAACLGSPLVTLFMGNTRDARDLQTTLQGACAEAARIRANMTRIQAETARQGSALMQRSVPVSR